MQLTHQRSAGTLRDRKAAALRPPNLAFRPFAASPTAVFRQVSRRVGGLRRPSSTPSSSPPPCAHRRAQIRMLATSLKSAFVVTRRVGPNAACRSCRVAVSVQHVHRRVPGRLGAVCGSLSGLRVLRRTLFPLALEERREASPERFANDSCSRRRGRLASNRRGAGDVRRAAQQPRGGRAPRSAAPETAGARQGCGLPLGTSA